MLLPLICAALATAPPQKPLSAGLLAVLEIKNKLKEDVDAGFLSDELRNLALKQVPGLRVITRENMLVLLQSTGKKLEECEGECEVDTGRRIGADLVVSGELLKFGTSYKLDLKLHETSEGRLLAGAIASGKTIDDLDAATPAAATELFAPLRLPPSREAQDPQQGAQGPQQGPQNPQQGATGRPPAQVRPGAAALPPGQGQQAQATPPRPAPGAQGQPRPEARPRPLREHPVIRRDNRSGLEFVRLLEGSVHVGCATGDTQCRPEERPARELGIGGFWIGRTEVTTGAFAACAKARACSAQVERRDVRETAACNWHNRRWNHPINCVTFAEAEAFCRWTGGRLPTALEWEYAAKSGDDVIYPWGNEPPTGARANFCDVNCRRGLKNPQRQGRGADESLDDGYAGTAPVGSYPAGATRWDLLDMAGNVGEWTATSWGTEKEIRGGNWAMPTANLRASHRHHLPPQRNEGALGFRCVQ